MSQSQEIQISDTAREGGIAVWKKQGRWGGGGQVILGQALPFH